MHPCQDENFANLLKEHTDENFANLLKEHTDASVSQEWMPYLSLIAATFSLTWNCIRKFLPPTMARTVSNFFRTLSPTSFPLHSKLENFFPRKKKQISDEVGLDNNQRNFKESKLMAHTTICELLLVISSRLSKCDACGRGEAPSWGHGARTGGASLATSV